MKLVRYVLEFYATIAVPLVYLLGLYLISLGNSVSYGLGVRGAFLVLAVMGMGLWVMSYVSLGNAFGVLPRKQRRVDKGVYRWFDHPMYIGILFTYLGLSVANESAGGTGFTTFILLPLLWMRSQFEDKALRD